MDFTQKKTTSQLSQVQHEKVLGKLSNTLPEV